jgi:hypothetical protein
VLGVRFGGLKSAKVCLLVVPGRHWELGTEHWAQARAEGGVRCTVRGAEPPSRPVPPGARVGQGMGGGVPSAKRPQASGATELVGRISWLGRMRLENPLGHGNFLSVLKLSGERDGGLGLARFTTVCPLGGHM